jgi:hypothetical protein
VVQKGWGHFFKKEGAVQLVYWYVACMIAGDFAAYFIGLFVEYEWGSNVSLIVFLALYFLSLWVAWIIAVWATEPKKADPAADAGSVEPG